METRSRLDPLPYDRSFVVQLGRDADPGTGTIAGRAEHIASGRSLRFRSWDELIAFVASCAPRSEPGQPGGAARRDPG